MMDTSPAIPFKDMAVPSPAGDLAGRLYAAPGEARAGAVISHGLFSSMQSAKLSRLAAVLASAGCRTLFFDHSGCGDSPGDISATTLTTRRDETLAAARALLRLYPDLPLIYLGSSLGGTSSLLANRELPGARLICWSSPWDLLPLGNRLAADPESPRLPGFLEDLENHDIPGILGETGDILFIHGGEDEVVPVEQARSGYQLAGEPKDIMILPGADHRLTLPADQEKATIRTLAWLQDFVLG